MKRPILSHLMCALFGVLALSLSPARAGGTYADAFQLARYVPAGAHFCAVGKDTPDRARIVEAYWRAFEKLCYSGIGRDIFDLATSELSPNRREEAMAWANRIVRLITTPNWRELTRDEVAFAFKLSMPIPVYLVMFRVPKETAQQRKAEFTTTFKEVAELASQLVTVTEGKRQGAEVTSLRLSTAPVALSVATKGDVVALATTDEFLDCALRLMDSPAEGESLVAQDRFRKAFDGLPAPQDGIVYMDLSGYLNLIGGFLGQARAQAGGDPHGAGMLSIVNTVLEELSRLDTIASVERTEGGRTFSDSRLSFLHEGGHGFIEELLRDRRPFRGIGRAIPKDAIDFYATSGLDLERIYSGILDLIQDRMPEGQGLLAGWDRLQEEFGFNLQRDLLAWLEGGFGWVSLPGGPLGTEIVFVLTVKDVAKAEETVRGVLGRTKRFLESRGQGVEFAPVPAIADGFHEVRIDALPFLRPGVGLVGNSLILSSSVEAVQRVLRTMRGEAPSMLENPRFTALGIPDGDTCELFYEDLEGALSAFANVLGAIGFIASILPEERETRPILKVGQILTKLAAFLRDIDLELDRAGWMRYDPEAHALFARRMMHLRVPEGGTREKF